MMTIKEIRKAAGMTQAAFAEYIGVNKSTVEKWEHGNPECPDYIWALIEYKLKKEGTITEIKIFVYGHDSIIMTSSDGRWIEIDIDSQGRVEHSDICIFDTDAISHLRQYYENADMNAFDENFREWKESGKLPFGYSFDYEIAADEENELTEIYSYIE